MTQDDDADRPLGIPFDPRIDELPPEEQFGLVIGDMCRFAYMAGYDQGLGMRRRLLVNAVLVWLAGFSFGSIAHELWPRGVQTAFDYGWWAPLAFGAGYCTYVALSIRKSRTTHRRMKL